MKAAWGIGLALASAAAFAGQAAPLFSDDFASFDTARWAVEAEDGAAATPTVRDHALYLDSARGLTVWFRQPLRGAYEIDFTRTVLDEGQPHDRVSDLNLFWLAQLDEKAPAAVRFGRSGQLDAYNDLRLFYAGIGGNGNTTTRFRYDDGSGARGLLQEYLAAPYLLRANHAYRIQVRVNAAGTALYVDGQRYFSAAGPIAPSGYFAFRTTKSRQKIEHFAVYPLTETGTPP
jgi:hypothetical protein